MAAFRERPLSILTKRIALLASDTRLGFRLVLRRWKQIERTKRNRIELTAVLLLLPLSAAVAALAAMPSALELDASQIQMVVEAVAPPSIADKVTEPIAREEAYMREARIQRGETLAGFFSRLSISDAAALHFVQTDAAARPLVRLAPDRYVQASVQSDGRLQWLKVHGLANADGGNLTGRTLILDRGATSEAGFRVIVVDEPLERRIEMKSGEVRVSLFGATDEAEIPDSVARQMIDALEGEIELHSDLRRGAVFRVIYEELYSAGQFVRAGRLLAVEMENGDKRIAAYWFADGSKQGGFYTADGRSLKRTFLRSALEYTRISSGFSTGRTHPLFGYDAAHRGTDYAASAGVNVRAVADGVVTFAGRQRGYGNVVEIKHDGKYATLYAHLQSIAPGLRQGAAIGQSDAVGTVGTTGWATGPNLHYELKINGVQVDPLVTELPSAEPLNATQLANLAQTSATLRAQLALLERVAIALYRPR
ncbi:MAG TPA: peptidoglycan DD-metalloendopeptidase family protein [Burkholderiaceae bacterium]|nr:peptidoglycan DD-metalloendopeptidase family protein [Burkholderiaceae bacterium]